MSTNDSTTSDQEPSEGGTTFRPAPWIPTGVGTGIATWLRSKIEDVNIWSWIASPWGPNIAFWSICVLTGIVYVGYVRRRWRNASLQGVRWGAVLVGYLVDFGLTVLVAVFFPNPFSSAHYILSSLSTVFGSFLAGKLAKRHQVKHGVLVVLADCLLLLILSFFAPMDFGTREIMRLVVAFIAGIFGGYLSRV
jgi:putative membrane protein (TIGR04086 family)